MNIELISKEKNIMELKVLEGGETLLIPLRNQLVTDPAVDHANYSIRHPNLDPPILRIEVGSGKPQNALKKAAKSLSNQYKEMLLQFQKQS